MKKGILWAFRQGLSLREAINKNGTNDIIVHIFNNGESVQESTYIEDKKWQSRFKRKEGCGRPYTHYAIFWDEGQWDENGKGIGKPTSHNWGKMICGDYGLCPRCQKEQMEEKSK